METKFICENKSCRKDIPHTNQIAPLLSLCCCKLFCSFCFTQSTHSCSDKKMLQMHYSQSIPCSRCKLKISTYQCQNCKTGSFCKQCCQIIHRSDKYSFHNIRRSSNRQKPLKVQKQRNTKVQNCDNPTKVQKFNDPMKVLRWDNPKKVEKCYDPKQNQISNQTKSSKLLEKHYLENQQKQNVQNKVKAKCDILQYQCQNIALPCFSDKTIGNFLNCHIFQQDVQNLILSLNIKKSLVKMKLVQVDEKWLKIKNSVEAQFKIIHNKLSDLLLKINSNICMQSDINMNETSKVMESIQFMEIQALNLKNLLKNPTVKNLILKNTNNSENLNLFTFLNSKFDGLSNFFESIEHSINFKSMQKVVSHQFLQMMKKNNERIDSLDLFSVIKVQKGPQKNENWHNKFSTDGILIGGNASGSKIRNISIQLEKVTDKICNSQLELSSKGKNSKLSRIKSYEVLNSHKICANSPNQTGERIQKSLNFTTSKRPSPNLMSLSLNIDENDTSIADQLDRSNCLGSAGSLTSLQITNQAKKKVKNINSPKGNQIFGFKSNELNPSKMCYSTQNTANTSYANLNSSCKMETKIYSQAYKVREELKKNPGKGEQLKMNHNTKGLNKMSLFDSYEKQPILSLGKAASRQYLSFFGKQ